MKTSIQKLLACALVLTLLCTNISAFAEGLFTLSLPEALETIEEEAFYGDTSIDKVVVPEGVIEIGRKAFAYSSLNEISLPSSLQSIAYDAFDGCSNEPIIFAEKGTYAYTWATAHHYIAVSPETLVSEIQFGRTNISLQLGDIYNPSDYMVILPSDADNKTVVWTSSNPKIASVNSTTGVITALSYGQTQISASATDGSNVCASINVEVYPEAPDITSMQLVNGTSISIQWEEIKNVDRYYIYYASEGTEGEFYCSEYSDIPEYILEGLDENTTYCIWITAEANGIMSYDSNPWYITTEKHMIPLNIPEITNVSCSSADDGITVSWKPVTNATGYNVCYSLNTNTEAATKLVVNGGSTSTAKISGVTAGKTYYVWIQAITSTSESEFSDTSLVVVPEEISCNLCIYDDDDSWSPKYEPSTAEFYIICDSSYSVAKTSGASWLTIEKAGNTLVLSTTMNTTGSTRNATVSIWCDEHDEEVEIRVKQKTGVDFPKPTVNVTVNSSYFKATWNANSNAEEYDCQCAMGDTDNITYEFSNDADGLRPTIYDFNYDGSINFFFRVRYSASTNDGPWSDWVYVVMGNDIPVTSVSVNSVSKTLYVGSTVTLKATVKPSNALCQDVTWSIVSGQNYASIDSATGKLTAVKAGTVKVRATSTDGKNVYGERTLTIYGPEDSTDPVTSISITNSNFSMQLGDSKTLTAKVLPSYATNPAVNWSVRNGSGRATISSNGVLTATAAGTVYVRAEAQDGSGVKSAEITVTINEHEHTWGEEYSVNGSWYQSCTSCSMTKAIVKYQSGAFVEGKPEFLNTPTVSGGPYAGDDYVIHCSTTSNVSRIVICYSSGTQTIEKEDASDYSQVQTSSTIAWSIPYHFEYTGNSDTRTVILRCYDKAGNYDEVISVGFTCKKREVPKVSLVASTSTTVSNQKDTYVWIDANIASAELLTMKVLNSKGSPIYFRTAYHVNSGLSAVKEHSYTVNTTDTIFTGIGLLFPAGIEDGSYTVQMIAKNSIGDSAPAELIVQKATGDAYYSSAAVSARMDDLYTKLGSQGFFTANRQSCNSSFEKGHACNNCFNENVLNSTWFQSIFGSISCNWFPTSYGSTSGYTQRGWSCLGFAHFAEYWLYCNPNNPSSKVSTKKVGTYEFNQINATTYAQTGDVIRFGSTHSAICYYSDENGMYVLDCNWGLEGKQCHVDKHYIPYSNYTSFTISRAYNAEQ